MRKFLGLLIMLMMIASSCLAMTFSQPVEVGNFVAANIGGFLFKSVSENNGTLVKNGRKGVYERGIARFGNGSDALFFHYKNGTSEKRFSDYIMAFGSDNINNTVNVNVMIPKLYKINSDKGITFYLIRDSYDLPDEIWWTLIGRRKDGVWVKYFDSDSVTVKYFGEFARAGRGNVWEGKSICCENFRVNGDTIVIEYSRYHKNINKRGELVKEGEFRFKWDDKAQWFSVERIIY